MAGIAIERTPQARQQGVCRKDVGSVRSGRAVRGLPAEEARYDGRDKEEQPVQLPSPVSSPGFPVPQTPDFVEQREPSQVMCVNWSVSQKFSDYL